MHLKVQFFFKLIETVQYVIGKIKMFTTARSVETFCIKFDTNV